FTNLKRARDEQDAFNLAQLYKYKSRATSADATGQLKSQTGKEAMDAFDAASEDLLSQVGARPLLKTSVIGTLIGDGRTWDEFRLLHFPSRAAYESYTKAVKNLADVTKLRNAAIDDSYVMKVETMSLAKRIALSLATSVVDPKEPETGTEASTKEQQDEP
ncbi:MAG: hypothetical protein AAF664_12455, partial [Planctomycetota bacterium]